MSKTALIMDIPENCQRCLLLNDNLAEVAGITHSGRALSRTYRPTEASRDVILQDFTENYNRFSNVIGESMLCVKILTDNKAPEKAREEIKKLRELLEDWKSSLQ